MKKIISIVGARPQFIKAASISREIINNYSSVFSEKIIHTGQHYDENMSQIFFEELSIPKPAFNLNIGGSSHGQMTGRMIIEIEKVLLEEKPDILLLYGDTNSTLAGAVAGAKLHIQIAHVEAGLRSYNNKMPEEINRVLTDKVSTWLFCPTDQAVANLLNEGQTIGVHNVGDVMYDACLYIKRRCIIGGQMLQALKIRPREYILATCHRAENTDDKLRLEEIISALIEISRHTTVVFSIHPRTRHKLKEFGIYDLLENLTVTDPLSYINVSTLLSQAKCLLTDSGGMQKEAFFYGVPCITLRNETEWIETVTLGGNILVGASREKIIEAYRRRWDTIRQPHIANPYGDGTASRKILEILR